MTMLQDRPLIALLLQAVALVVGLIALCLALAFFTVGGGYVGLLAVYALAELGDWWTGGHGGDSLHTIAWLFYPIGFLAGLFSGFVAFFIVVPATMEKLFCSSD